MSNFSKTETKVVKQIITDYLHEGQYTHFLTIRLPRNRYGLDPARKTLKGLNDAFQYKLQGRRWNKHHLPFVAIAERGRTQKYHFHLLLLSYQFTTEQIQQALNDTCVYLNLPDYTFKLQAIDYCPQQVSKYCAKELTATKNLHIDTDRIIYSDELLDNPPKR
jgi:hypothetical protein